MDPYAEFGASKTSFFKTLSSEKRWILFVFFPVSVVVYLVVALIIDHYYRDASRAVDIGFTIFENVLVFAWCRVDSDERRIKLHRLFSFAVIFLGLLVLIYYFFRSRGFRGGFAAFGWFILYVVCAYVVAMIAALAVMLILTLAGILPATVFN